MPEKQFKPIFKRLWTWILIATLLVWVYPIEYQLTRILFVFGLVATVGGGVILWWHQKWIRFCFIVPICLLLILLCLPGRKVSPEELEKDYTRSLRWFHGTRYVWGGENLVGIDCSGLVRKGLFWAQVRYGLRTFNGLPIREALELWWYDGSADALLHGYRDWTTRLFESKSINQTDHSLLQVGDVAITADGIHAFAYIGDETWIEADPDQHKVIVEKIPSTNSWFERPVVFVRWKWLMVSEH
ncbi:MAG: NlpC/P60 family protein [Verrucomicrobiota bacterium]|jgi:hypothetical protein